MQTLCRFFVEALGQLEKLKLILSTNSGFSFAFGDMRIFSVKACQVAFLASYTLQGMLSILHFHCVLCE